MSRPYTSLKPRKKPVQARSTFTVESIFSATIQVLVEQGMEKLTTTRVAEKAGTSVGTLYQYFPNKASLIAAVLEQHLVYVVEEVEAAGARAKGGTVRDIAVALVNAFVDAKLKDIKASKALYAVAAQVGGAEVVARMTQRSQIAICDVLATASDGKFDDLRIISLMLSSAPQGPIQAILATADSKPISDAIRFHLLEMTCSYLSQLQTGK